MRHEFDTYGNHRLVRGKYIGKWAPYTEPCTVVVDPQALEFNTEPRPGMPMYVGYTDYTEERVEQTIMPVLVNTDEYTCTEVPHNQRQVMLDRGMRPEYVDAYISGTAAVDGPPRLIPVDGHICDDDCGLDCAI